MKRTLIIAGLVMLGSACSHSGETLPAAGATEGGVFAEIDNAVADIAKNGPKLIALRSRTDAASAEYWNVAIAHRIPEQPAAVLRLMAKAGVPVDKMCPREVIEDELSFAEYVQWMENAVAALDSLVLETPSEEVIRKDCLRAIRDSLSTKDRWKY